MIKKSLSEPQVILGIETSCDETAAAVGQITDNGVRILSNVVASSLKIQSKYGGVVPEQAAREQQKAIIPVIKEALEQAHCQPQDLDAIAVTCGPGLIGSLLVGTETAKTLSLVWQKPLIPVNHLIGHFYANWITDTYPPSFPIIGLLISGGHTDLVLFKNHTRYQHLGGTRDDAAGECFDKCARLLGLPYPGGPAIAQAAVHGNPNIYKLPRPMIDSKNLDFSFSGLKTAVANIVQSFDNAQDKSSKLKVKNEKIINNLAAAVQEAVADVLVKKTINAAQKYNVEQIMIAGGVAANLRFKEVLLQRMASILKHGRAFIPHSKLCTDNAAMIAAASFYHQKTASPLKLQANPSLYI